MAIILGFSGGIMDLFWCFAGEVGCASKMNLVLQLMMGVAVAGVAEGMALADRAGLQQRDVLEILELTTLSCPLLLEKGKGNDLGPIIHLLLFIYY